MIELRGRLVVPTAPGCAAVDADHRTLIAGQRNNLSVVAIEPNSLVVIAARRALPSHKSFSAVHRFPGGGIRNVNHVRIFRRHCNSHRARPSSAYPPIVIHLRPGFSAIVRAIHAGFFAALDRCVDSLRIARRNRQPNPRDSLFRSGQSVRQWFPGRSTICGFVNAAPGNINRPATADFPRRNARRPQRRIQHLRIHRIHHQLPCADVLILIKHLFEIFPAIR